MSSQRRSRRRVSTPFPPQGLVAGRRPICSTSCHRLRGCVAVAGASSNRDDVLGPICSLGPNHIWVGAKESLGPKWLGPKRRCSCLVTLSAGMPACRPFVRLPWWCDARGFSFQVAAHYHSHGRGQFRSWWCRVHDRRIRAQDPRLPWVGARFLRFGDRQPVWSSRSHPASAYPTTHEGLGSVPSEAPSVHCGPVGTRRRTSGGSQRVWWHVSQPPKRGRGGPLRIKLPHGVVPEVPPRAPLGARSGAFDTCSRTSTARSLVSDDTRSGAPSLAAFAG